MNRLACLLIFFLLLSWNTGCTPKTPPPPPTVKVSGTVNLDGKPMPSGEVRFNVMGQGAKQLEIKDGAFSGEAYIGKNHIDVVWEKELPNPSNPKMGTMKVNTVSDKFSGPNSTLKADIPAGEAKEFKFDVTSAKAK